jgi:outer membrane cobalamin receptor
MKNVLSLCLIIIILAFTQVNAMGASDVRTMNRRQLKSLSHDQLLDLPLEDLVYVASKLGVSIDDLLDATTTVSSKTALSTRETPGIISVISRQDIINSGAQDLADILRTIPGIYFGYDVEGVGGIIMRGNWGHEGKVLFLIDDMELNENMYSVVQIFNHIPADQIKQVEVIRGPGSALYGGYAELGVIRITTFNGEDLKETAVYGMAGTYGSGLNRNSIGFNTGGSKQNSSWALMGTLSSAEASNGNFTSIDDKLYDLQDEWLKSNNLLINAKYSFHQLQAQFVYDDYSINPVGYGKINPNRFRNFFSQVKYNYQPTDKITITPAILYKNQTPFWFTYDLEDDFWFYKRIASQLSVISDMVWNPLHNVQVISGIGYKSDSARITEEEQQYMEESFYNDRFDVNHYTAFAYAQGSLSTRYGNFFAGARAENHSVTGNNIAPRFGYTHIYKRLNVKYLYSHAFRSPSIENVNLNPDINIERTLVNELALGYRISNNFYTTVNLYDIVIKDPIVYFFGYEDVDETYYNEDQTGSSGLEFELKAVYPLWNASFSYSYFDASKNNQSDVYGVFLPGGQLKKMMKGSPSHMLHLSGSVKLSKKMWLNPVLSWYSSRYGYLLNADEQTEVNPYMLADLNLLTKNFLIRNLDMVFSVKNILNSKYEYIQPYGFEGLEDRPIPSIPGKPLEVMLQLKYRF